MRSAITLSLVRQARGGPFVFWDALEASFHRAAELGFDAVEIFPPSAEALDLAAIQKLCETTKLKIAAVGTGAGWVVNRLRLTDADESIRSQANAFIRDIIRAAAELHAPAIIGSMQGRFEGAISLDQARRWLGEQLADLGSYAGERGQPLLYEPLNRYETNLLNRLAETSSFLKSLPCRNIQILADIFHQSIEEADVAAALHSAGSLVGHVHFADSNRHAVGFGHTNYVPILQSLREIGYNGYLSAEVLPLPDGQAAAEQTIRSFRALTEKG